MERVRLAVPRTGRKAPSKGPAWFALHPEVSEDCAHAHCFRSRRRVALSSLRLPTPDGYPVTTIVTKTELRTSPFETVTAAVYSPGAMLPAAEMATETV